MVELFEIYGNFFAALTGIIYTLCFYIMVKTAQIIHNTVADAIYRSKEKL